MEFSELAAQAAEQGRCISLDYHGERRRVEVHAVGVSAKGRPCARVFQVFGDSEYSKTKDTTGWKMLSLDEIENTIISVQNSQAPRPGYKPGDIGMARIFWEISNEPVSDPPSTPP